MAVDLIKNLITKEKFGSELGAVQSNVMLEMRRCSFDAFYRKFWKIANTKLNLHFFVQHQKSKIIYLNHLSHPKWFYEWLPPKTKKFLTKPSTEQTNFQILLTDSILTSSIYKFTFIIFSSTLLLIKMKSFLYLFKIPGVRY